jgi:hypothetical protein
MAKGFKEIETRRGWRAERGSRGARRSGRQGGHSSSVVRGRVGDLGKVRRFTGVGRATMAKGLEPWGERVIGRRQHIWAKERVDKTVGVTEEEDVVVDTGGKGSVWGGTALDKDISGGIVEVSRRGNGEEITSIAVNRIEGIGTEEIGIRGVKEVNVGECNGSHQEL